MSEPERERGPVGVVARGRSSADRGGATAEAARRRSGTAVVLLRSPFSSLFAIFWIFVLVMV